MKKTVITVVIAVSLATLVGLKLFRWGWTFGTQTSPDGQYRVELRQVIRDLRTLPYLRDSDVAEGWIVLTDHDGKLLWKAYDKQLTFVIVIWGDSSVEIQSWYGTSKWNLNR